MPMQEMMRFREVGDGIMDFMGDGRPRKSVPHPADHAADGSDDFRQFHKSFRHFTGFQTGASPTRRGPGCFVCR